MSSVVKENYLKALFFLDRHEGPVNVTALSKKLGVSKPSASNMVKRLMAEGWVTQEKYQPIQLTEPGRQKAKQIIRKHRLTELFLHEIMGFGWGEVHEIAEQMEHINSGKLFDRMDEMLNFPQVDPHGSPIPDRTGQMKQPPYVSLITLAVGDVFVLRALSDSSPELLRVLDKYQLQLGDALTLLRREEYDGSYTLHHRTKGVFTLTKKVGDHLLVECPIQK